MNHNICYVALCSGFEPYEELSGFDSVSFLELKTANRRFMRHSVSLEEKEEFLYRFLNFKSLWWHYDGPTYWEYI